ncbi:hypothetical protein RND81_02G053200 [Saponaria officinalis]|uniref:F-box domain-containing protein n=1 Tax=Saponaria officinalis TaxID=3572 RepID=A0AAW1MR97_SAPOF
MNSRLKRCCADRLSGLPDELVCHILSLLPTKDAAVVSLSSRKMRRTFTQMTTLDFDDSPISYCAENHPRLIERFQFFKMFVNSVLLASRSPHLSRFRLKFGGDWRITLHHFNQRSSNCGIGCFPDLESTQLNAWIGFPLSRSGVREIDLCIHVRKPEKLPSALFACEALHVLKIDTNLDFELVSGMTSFRLPNLKVLELRSILIPEDDFVNRLLSNCPVLEELCVDCLWKYGNKVTISSPSLKKLAIYFSRGDEFSDFISIDTPNLRYLKYTDLAAVHYSVASMKALVGASLHVWDYLPSYDECFDSMLCLVKAVSNVKHLSLMCSSVEALNYGELKNHLPVFHNLTYLKLGHSNVYTKWNPVLLELLKCCPLLQILGFPRGLILNPRPEPSSDECYIEAVESERNFFRTNQGTPCCKSSLKKIFIKKYWGSFRELELVRFLLKIASVLEELLIVCVDTEEKSSLETTLMHLPRASSNCSIIVQ